MTDHIIHLLKSTTVLDCLENPVIVVGRLEIAAAEIKRLQVEMGRHGEHVQGEASIQDRT